MFTDYLQQKKEVQIHTLHTFIASHKNNRIPDNKWRNDMLERLARFIPSGKMIRAALVYLGFEVAGAKAVPDIDSIALAAEFFQSGLLIHDDIMDNDKQRRGQPSVHMQYTDLMHKLQSRDPQNSGKSLALCVGNAAYFYGFELLGAHETLVRLFAQELADVVTAQMQDVSWGATENRIPLESILSMYQYKTGRYSIALPLMAGALLGEAHQDTVKHLEKFGSDLGVAFQLKDDSLNLFGNPEITGKPIGSDLREKKQTPYMFFLSMEQNAQFDEKIKKIIHRGRIEESDITDIIHTIKKLGIDQKVFDLQEKYTKSAKETLQKIPMKEETKLLFDAFVEYLINRVQ